MLALSSVLLRCDATTSGGVGHFVRCTALAGALKDAGVDRVVLTGDIEAPLARQMLARMDVDVRPRVEDSADLLALADDVGADLVHVDHYDGFEDLRAVGRRHAVATSTATDELFGRREADVIVDGSPRSLHAFDPLYGTAAVCLGPQHLAIRPELATTEVRRTADAAPVSVLILMGGTDAAGLGLEIAEAVRRLPAIGRVGIVGGESNPRSTGGAPLVGVDRLPDLVELLDGWDLVVTAAGTTVWELARLGVPMAVVGVTANQRDHYEFLTGGGFAIGMGFLAAGEPLAGAELAAALASTDRLRSMVAAARALVDGRGAERIVAEWTRAVHDGRSVGMHVRPATRADAGRLFAWRDDATTRASSRERDPLVWADHVEWLEGTLTRSDRRLLVAVSDGEAVGTTRFDRLQGGEWEVSITVAPQQRGRRLAAPMIAASTQWLAAVVPGLDRVAAMLRVDNSASRSVFRGLGYSLSDTDGEWERWTAALRADPS